MNYQLWDSCVPHTTSTLQAKAFLFQFSFTDISHMKTIGAPVLQYLFKTALGVVSWPGKHFAWLHSLSLNSSSSHNCLILCCTDKYTELMHDYHFTLYTHACCKQDRRKRSVIKFSDLLVYCIMFKTELCIFSFKLN